MHSFYAVCEQLVDGRKARGKRYDLAGVLVVMVLAKLAGMSSVLAVSIRAHWKGENHLHWRRDALLGEDRCRARFTPVMQMLAVLTTTVLSLMHLHQVSTVARQLRRFASHPEEAISWVLSDF